ncbi:MAG: acyltransferase [Microthrixaceae bacterium]|nr:acyltransferase [Microthrixaceae bacterium]
MGRLSEGLREGVNPLGYQPTLDGVRALAVIAVIVYHVHEPVGPGGWAGVQLFFVLSGFLITSLLLDELSGSGRISVGRFYARRALRLLPALVFMLVTYTSIMAVATGGDTGREALYSSLRAMTYGYNWFVVSAGDWSRLAHLWSLSVEEQFYLLWPLIVVVVVMFGAKASRSHGLTTLRASVLIVVTTVAMLGSAYLQAYLMSSGSGGQRAVAGTDATAYPILAGCLLAQLRSLRMYGDWPRARNASGILGALAFVVVAFGVKDAGFVTRVVVTCAAIAMVWGVTDSGAPSIGRVFESRAARSIGRISYGLYLWHVPAIIIVGAMADQLGMPAWLETIATIFVFVVAAEFSFRFVERPFLVLKRRFETAGAPRMDVPAGHVSDLEDDVRAP